MSKRVKLKIGLWAWLNWAFVIGAFIGCTVARCVDGNLKDALGTCAAILVLAGSILGAVAASNLTWKGRNKTVVSSSQREYVKDRLTLIGW